MTIDYITNSIFNSRTYIIQKSTDQVWLIDCGDVDRVLEIIGDKTVSDVFLTHAHFDHIYGLPSLLNVFPNVRIYTNEWGKTALANDKLNMSRYHEQPVIVDGDNVMALHDGDMIDGVSIFETPGHNPSCICFQIENAFFTGDAHIPGITVVTNLPRGNKELAVESEKRILQLSEGKIIYPGHSLI